MSKSYTSQTHSNGITYTTEHDTESGGGSGCGLVLLLLTMLGGFIFMVVAQTIYQKTGYNILERN